MRKFAIAAVAVLAIAGSTAVYAQHRHWGYGHSRMNPEDRAAYADARIAAVHAGLKLNADQEKLWPPVETAVTVYRAILWPCPLAAGQVTVTVPSGMAVAEDDTLEITWK